MTDNTEPLPSEAAVAEATPEQLTSYGPEHPDYPNAPSDWDGGPYRCRDGGMYHMRGYGWEHGLGSWNTTADWDRVGYTSRTGYHLDDH